MSCRPAGVLYNVPTSGDSITADATGNISFSAGPVGNKIGLWFGRDGLDFTPQWGVYISGTFYPLTMQGG